MAVFTLKIRANDLVACGPALFFFFSLSYACEFNLYCIYNTINHGTRETVQWVRVLTTGAW